jgi:hypothetical protein
MNSELYDEFLKFSSKVADRMLAEGFEDTKKAYARFGIPFQPKTVEEYERWLTEKYPMPVPDWM